MVVVGFDFGNASSYIAIAREGGIEVLTNDYSLHSTPSCVAFGPKNRSMGYAARQQLNVNFKNTVINYKHLVGRDPSDPLTKLFLKYISCETQVNDGSISFNVNYLNEKRSYTATQVAGCFFQKLKEIVECSGNLVNECVISVPYFLNSKERSAVFAAAKIAGVEKVKITTDQAAIGTAYGIYKGSSLPAQDQPSKIVVFVDAGHSSFQASIMAFNDRKVAILGAAHDASVGGLFFDDCIREYFREQFLNKYKIDASKNPRAWQRLLDECDKLKKQMSANSTAIPLNIECFMEGIDVSGSMKREQFEELATPLFKKVTNVLENLVNQVPDIKIDDISEIELIGGCSRIPKIKQLVADFFKKDPMTTMNLDDAIARGCALQAALLSPTVIIKEFTIQDKYDTEEIKLDYDIVSDVKVEKEMERVDLNEKQKADARNTLEEYCYKIRNQVDSDKLQKLTEEDKGTIFTKTDEVLSWLEEDDDSGKDVYEKRYKELCSTCNPIIRKITKSKKDDKKKEEKNAENGNPASDKTEAGEKSPGGQQRMDTDEGEKIIPFEEHHTMDTSNDQSRNGKN